MSLSVNKSVRVESILKTEFGASIKNESVEDIGFIVKVININHDKEVALATTVSVSKDGMSETKFYEFPINLVGDNVIKQAYEYLKTLDEFQDAEDV